MIKKKINISSLGDPTSPSTWSGTPYNLYSELKKQDSLGNAFNSTAKIGRIKGKFIAVINKIYYNNSAGMGRGFLNRFLNAKKSSDETQKSISNLTLHMGTLDLPFFKLPKNQKHYLFCDSTWNLWSSNSTDSFSGYKARLLRDAENLERKSYHQTEHIFSISEYVKDNLVNHYGINQNKITVVGTGLGVIQPFFGEKDYSNGKILFAAKGRFEDKGGPLVLQAFEKALKKNPKLELIIVGQNDYTDKINAQNVSTYGFISIEELQSIFNESSLFLMPAFNEPWGLVYLEALSCKMPIVGLNRNSFPELSGNGKYGFGLQEANVEQLSDILVKAFENSKNLREMGIKGQEFCLNTFSWNKTVSKILKTIEDS